MLKEAKCTGCGANIQADPTQDAAICEYCGAPFIVEKAINNYNIANAQISAQTVNVNVGLTDFVIEGGVLVKYRGNAAEVIIPSTVKAIGEKVFEDCISITSVVIPKTVTEIRGGCDTRTDGWLGGNSTGAFNNCSNLTTISILGNSIKIQCGAFTGCDNLTHWNIENSITLCSYLTVDDSVDFIISKDGTNDRLPTHDYSRKEAHVWLILVTNRIGFRGDNRPIYINGRSIDVYKWYKIIRPKCYIATAVYGSYDAPQVMVLRRFRDEILMKSAAGRLFIKTYYNLSPPIARKMEKTHRLNAIVRRILDKFVDCITKKD